jgi:peptidylprolyl isomerase
VRKIIALSAAACLLVSLAACASSAPSGACEPSHMPGDASSIVTADGTFGNAPDATFPTPLVTHGIEVSAVTKGKGATIYPNQYATFQATAYDAETGDVIVAAAYDPSTPLIAKAGASTSKVGYLFECQKVGSRIAATMKASDLYGFGNVDASTPGLTNADATIVLVADIQGSVLGKAYGTPQIPQQGMPSVVTDADGVPGVTLLGGAAPTTLKIAVLQQGDGKKVAEGDTVYIHYLRVKWDDPSANKSTWTTDPGNPQPVLVAAIDATSGTGLNPGMLKAITGQRVGTQVLAIVPPAFGFPDGTAPTDVGAGDTLVYVIDILGIKSK